MTIQKQSLIQNMTSSSKQYLRACGRKYLEGALQAPKICKYLQEETHQRALFRHFPESQIHGRHVRKHSHLSGNSINAEPSSHPFIHSCTFKLAQKLQPFHDSFTISYTSILDIRWRNSYNPSIFIVDLGEPDIPSPDLILKIAIDSLHCDSW